MAMIRGNSLGADCSNCPFSKDGRPSQPVYGIYPEKPKFIIIGEGPGRYEVRYGEPFIGPSGEVVNKILRRIKRPREEIGITNATLCLPYDGADETVRSQAASACKMRLQMELAQRPGVPVLTFGAVAARAVIPKAELDAIDPPEGKAKRHQKRNKLEEQAKEAKKAAKRQAQIDKKRESCREKSLRTMMKAAKEQMKRELQRRGFKKPTTHGIKMALEDQVPQIEKAALARGDSAFETWFATKLAKIEERAKKKAKRPIRISDIASTYFYVDIDHSGPRGIIPAIHPAALLRGGGRSIAGSHTPDLAFINLVYDAAKIDALGRGLDVELTFPAETEFTDSARADRLVWQIYHDAMREGVFALDLETYVLDPERHHALQAYVAQIRAIGLATKNGAVSVLWDLLSDWAKKLIRFLLASKRVRKVYHNGLYDRTVLMARGFHLDGPWDDTLLMHHAVFPGCAHGLQVVTSQFFACRPWKSEFRNALESPESLTTYNAKDTYATIRIWETLTPLLEETATSRVYALDRAKSEIFTKMHLRGVPIDPDVNQELLEQFTAGVIESRRAVDQVIYSPEVQKQIVHCLAKQQIKGKPRKDDPEDLELRYQKRIDELEAAIREGKWHWKVSASKHVAALLEAMGVQLTKVTNSGQTSTKKDVLESLVHIPVVRDILRYREDSKLLSTFVYGAFDRYAPDGEIISYGYADEDNRVHSIWSVHKITGRVASTEMTFGNVPKAKIKKMPDGTYKIVRPNLRRQVVAPRRRVFVEFDFSQLEARIIALLSKDPFLVDVFASGKDIHTECARVVFPEFDSLGDGSGKLTKMQKQLRDNTKPLEYGAFYGGSPETLWLNLVKEGYKLTLADVTKAVNILMQKMPGVVAWQRNCIQTASMPPHEIREALYGRRRTFPLGQVDPNEAINFGVQAEGSALMDTGMIAMHQRLSKYNEAFEILQIHDAAVYECWEEDAVAIEQDVNECYTQIVDGIPFPIESSITYSWAGTTLDMLEARCRALHADAVAATFREDQLARRRQATAAVAKEITLDTDATKPGSVADLFPTKKPDDVVKLTAIFAEHGYLKLANEGKSAKLTAKGTHWLETREWMPELAAA